LNRLLQLARDHDLYVVEDAAHAIGTRYHGIRIGNLGDVTCFSFYATKNLAMGEGGAAVSTNPQVIERIRKLAYFGINKAAHQRYTRNGTWAYDVEELGYKCNLDSLHAALGLVQLTKLDRMNHRRRAIARRYREGLDPRLGCARDGGEHTHSYHLFPIRLPGGIDRDRFMARLRDRNIGTSVHFIPLHLHSQYRDRYRPHRFPVADRLFGRMVSIPMFAAMTDRDVEDVLAHINAVTEELS
jgi:dTDP-4-amino-4,6-dideoxygalactose transaminase